MIPELGKSVFDASPSPSPAVSSTSPSPSPSPRHEKFFESESKSAVWKNLSLRPYVFYAWTFLNFYNHKAQFQPEMSEVAFLRPRLQSCSKITESYSNPAPVYVKNQNSNSCFYSCYSE